MKIWLEWTECSTMTDLRLLESRNLRENSSRLMGEARSRYMIAFADCDDPDDLHSISVVQYIVISSICRLFDTRT